MRLGYVRAWAYAVALIVLVVLSPFAYSLSERRVQRLELLAVSAEGRGEVIPAEVWIEYPGTGASIISNETNIGMDTLVSAKLALFYSSLISGINPTTVTGGLNILYNEEVSGLSAGAAFLAGYYALLNGLAIDYKRVAITGVIAPNGFIAPVGGLRAKVKAALEHGIARVVAPKGNTMTEHGVRNVVGVCSSAALLRETSLYMQRSPGVNLTYVRGIDALFKYSAAELIRLLNKTMSLITGNSTVLNYVREALRLYHEGFYYPAASVAYSGIVVALSAMNSTMQEYVASLARSMVNSTWLAEELYKLKTMISKSKRVNLWCFEAVAAADYRLYAALKLVERKSAYEKAVGALRLLSAKHWLNVAERVCTADGLNSSVVVRDELDRAVKLLCKYAKLSVDYFAELVKAPNIKVRNPEELSLDELTKDMQLALIQKDYTRAYALAMSILSLITLEIIGYDASVSKDFKHISACGLQLFNFHVDIAGMYSLNALLLAEYAKVVNNTLTSAVMSNYAATYALLPLAILAVAHTPAATVRVAQQASEVATLAMLTATAIISAAGAMIIYYGVLEPRRKSSSVF